MVGGLIARGVDRLSVLLDSRDTRGVIRSLVAGAMNGVSVLLANP